MIETFHVQNYKALRDVTLHLTPMHVLIGPNDSGKTSILEALAAHCRLSHSPVGYAFEGRWDGRDLVWKQDKDLQVTFEIVVHEQSLHLRHSVSFDFTLDQGRNVVIGSESVCHVESGICSAHEVGHKAQSMLVNRNESEVTLVRQALTGCQKYRWIPSDLGLPVGYSFSARFGMEPSGFGLAMYLNDIVVDDHVRFGELERRFGHIFPSINRIRLKRVRSFPNPSATEPVDTGLGIYFEQPDGFLYPVSQASDGLLLVLAYLAILYSREPPRILLIEEPENGVHPQRLGEVLDILKELVAEQGKTQVLLTTHSPYVVDKFRPEEVTICLKGADGAVSTHRLSESKSVREQIDIFQLGEIWTAEGDEALAAPPAPEEASMP